MFYKPTNPVPFNTVVDVDDDTTTYEFSCDLFNDNVNEIDLILNDVKYKLTQGTDYFITNKKLTMKLTKGKAYETGTTGETSNTFTGLTSPTTYRWKVRQMGRYDVDSTTHLCTGKDEYITVGYGFTETGGTWKIKADSYGSDSTTSSNFQNFYIYKIRPHTDLYEYLPDTNWVAKSYRSSMTQANIDEPDTIEKERYQYKNDNQHYWINCGDRHIPIVAYFYGMQSSLFPNSLPTASLYGVGQGDPRNVVTTVDDYDDPLFAWILTDTPIKGEPYVGSIWTEENCVDIEYTITTNYIDSDEFQFKTKSAPSLTLTDFSVPIQDDLIHEDTDTIIDLTDLGVTSEYPDYSSNKNLYDWTNNKFYEHGTSTEIGTTLGSYNRKIGDELYLYEKNAISNSGEWYYINGGFYWLYGGELYDSTYTKLSTQSVSVVSYFSENAEYYRSICGRSIKTKSENIYIINNTYVQLVTSNSTPQLYIIPKRSNQITAYLEFNGLSTSFYIHYTKSSKTPDLGGNNYTIPYNGVSTSKYYIDETTFNCGTDPSTAGGTASYIRFLLRPVANIKVGDLVGYITPTTSEATSMDIHNYLGEIIAPQYTFNVNNASAYIEVGGVSYIKLEQRLYYINNTLYQLKRAVTTDNAGNSVEHEYSDGYLYALKYDHEYLEDIALWDYLNGVIGYNPAKSTINLGAIYLQDEGAEIVQYQTKLYDITSGRSLINDSGVVFDDDYSYEYSALKTGANYELDIELQNTDGQIINRYFYINPVYSTITIDDPSQYISVYWSSVKNSCIIQIVDFPDEDESGNEYNIDHFDIYKKIGDSTQLYYIGSMENNEENYFEDYIVGNACDYKYYICPMQAITGFDGKYKALTFIATETVQFKDKAVRVIGLLPTDNPAVYEVDLDNIWVVDLNVENDGFSHTIGSTFTDTLSRFPVAVRGNSFYRTVNVSGLIGKIDCNTYDYVDTFDNIMDWETFVNNGNPKAVIDLRGVVTIGDFDSNSFSYQSTINHEAMISITLKQLVDEKATVILGEYSNGTAGLKGVLKDKNKYILRDSNSLILCIQLEE